MSTQLCSQVNQRTIDNLIGQLKAFNLEQFYYAIVPDDERCILNTLGYPSFHTSDRPVNLKRLRCAIASDAQILRFRDEFLQRYSLSDEGFVQSGPSMRRKHNPYFWPEEGMTPRRVSGFNSLKHRHRINARVTYYHGLEQRRGWVGVFNLFSSGQQRQVVARINEDNQEFSELLAEYADTFNALAFRTMNPLANFGVLSPTCIAILQMVAEGNSSEEIGRQLHMSERGVDYHLDRARHILMAKNRTNLVAKAYQQGVL